MKKYLFIFLLLSPLYSWAVSFSEAEKIYHNILAQNGIRIGPKLIFSNSNEVNASASVLWITVNKGMLNITNRNEIALVLGHELAHWKLGHGGSSHTNEYAADRLGFYYASKAGYNACSGIKVFNKFKQSESSTHPHPQKRKQKFNC